MQHLNFEAMNHVPSTGVSLCLVVPNLRVESIARAPRNVKPQGDLTDAIETERPSGLSYADSLSYCSVVRIGGCQKARSAGNK